MKNSPKNRKKPDKNSGKLENYLNKSENKEFRELEKKFREKFKMIDIEPNGNVYGYNDQTKKYLCAKKEYYRYIELKNKKSRKPRSRKKEDYYFERYSNLNM